MMFSEVKQHTSFHLLFHNLICSNTVTFNFSCIQDYSLRIYHHLFYLIITHSKFLSIDITQNQRFRFYFFGSCIFIKNMPLWHSNREFDSGIIKNHPAGLIKPAFFMSNFMFLYVLVYNSVV